MWMHLKTTMTKICQIQESIQKVLYITFHLYEVQEWARLIYSDRSQNSGVSLEGGMDWKRHKELPGVLKIFCTVIKWRLDGCVFIH